VSNSIYGKATPPAALVRQAYGYIRMSTDIAQGVAGIITSVFLFILFLFDFSKGWKCGAAKFKKEFPLYAWPILKLCLIGGVVYISLYVGILILMSKFS
jgi:hypothetical protein